MPSKQVKGKERQGMTVKERKKTRKMTRKKVRLISIIPINTKIYWTCRKI